MSEKESSTNEELYAKTQDELSTVSTSSVTAPQYVSVLKDWVMGLTLAEQGTLLTCVRGPDNVRKDHPVKEFVRCFRRAIMRSSKPPGVASFMSPYEYMPVAAVNRLRGHAAFEATDEQLPAELLAFWESQVDDISHHFLLHFSHCAEIVGYRHPDSQVACFWRAVYEAICASFHMRPETINEMSVRLRHRGCF